MQSSPNLVEMSSSNPDIDIFRIQYECGTFRRDGCLFLELCTKLGSRYLAYR